MYKVLESELRQAKRNFDKLLALTLAFRDEDDCFQYTDIPEVATKLVSRWAKLWQDALCNDLPLDDRSRAGVMFMLCKIKKQFEEEMDVDYRFNFEPKPSNVIRQSAVATPSKRKQDEQLGSSEKRPCKALSQELEQCLHRGDAQWKEAQYCAITDITEISVAQLLSAGVRKTASH